MTSSRNSSQKNPAGGSLEGRNVLVTRAREQAVSLTKLLENQGAKVFRQPAIEILPLLDWKHVDAAIDKIDQFGWLVFVSVNGVRYFLARCRERGVHLEIPKRYPDIRMVAIGSKTALEMERHGLTVDLVPKNPDSHGLARTLIERIQSETALLVRADRGSDELSNLLEEAGISHRQIAVYRSADVKSANDEIVRRMGEGEIHWVTISSSAIAAATVNLFGDLLRRTRLVSISPTTSKKLRELGHESAAEATDFSMPGMVQAIIEFEHRQ